VATAFFATRFQGPSPRADWRAADRYVESLATDSDCVLIHPAHDEVLVRRYLTTTPTCLVVTDGSFELSQIPPSAHHLFVFADDDIVSAALAAQPKSGWTSSIVATDNMTVAVLSR